MSKCILLIFIVFVSCSESKNNKLLIKLSKENTQLTNELDSLKSLLTKEKLSSWTLHRNFHSPIKEGDSLLMTYLVTNEKFSVDSTIRINLFKINEKDTIQLDESKHIKPFYNHGTLFFSIKNLKKGSYFVKSTDTRSDYDFYYEWEIE